MTDTHLLDALAHNQCPDCKNFGFLAGPRGGSAQNMFCCNPNCRAGFNVVSLSSLTPQALTAFRSGASTHFGLITVQRIPKAAAMYYAPQVHVLVGGFTR